MKAIVVGAKCMWRILLRESSGKWESSDCRGPYKPGLTCILSIVENMGAY